MQIKWAERTETCVINFMLGKMWVTDVSPSELISRKKLVELLEEEMKYIILSLVEQHHPKAEFRKGMWLEFGRMGYDMNKKAAHRHYQLALQNGNARAAYRIGMLFEVSGNNLTAVQHYQQGVDLGDSASLYRFGMMLLLGQHGQLQDYRRAIDLIRASAETADENAPQGAYTYGMLLAQEPSQVTIPDEYLAKDLDAARTHMERAAVLGFCKAQLQMALAYEYGNLNCGSNPLLSLHYSLLAAAQGEADAEMLVSKWFLNGAYGFFERNEAVAFIYARRAARSGLVAAAFAMGYFHEVGIHVSVDTETAVSWYKEAAARGSEDAKSRLDSL